PEAAVPFITGLAQSGYFFPFLKGVEVAAGALPLARAFVPLALTALAPTIANNALFHLLLAPNLLMVALPVVLELSLAWSSRAAFAPMLRRRTPLSVPRLAPTGGDYGSQPERACAPIPLPRYIPVNRSLSPTAPIHTRKPSRRSDTATRRSCNTQ